MRTRRVPEVVVRRLALYLRVLNEVSSDAGRYISSQELGSLTGVTSAQVRKDLAMFGEFGKQGVGYDAGFLRDEVARILNADRVVNFCIVGAGELGTALARYTSRRFENEHGYPFRLVAMFDVDPDKIGTRVDDLTISHLDEVESAVKEKRIRIAILTVPSAAAQGVADTVCKAGLKSILNFVPARLVAPDNVRINNVDVTLDLHELAFFL